MTSGTTPLSHQALQTLDIRTNGRGFSRIDPVLSRWIATSGIERGVLNLTCLHTSASLTINENADPRVLKDLSAWMDDMVPESRAYLHDDAGSDDMPAHIRTALTCQTLSLSVERGRLLLGTRQAIYLWEHRRAHHAGLPPPHRDPETGGAEAFPVQRHGHTAGPSQQHAAQRSDPGPS